MELRLVQLPLLVLVPRPLLMGDALQHLVTGLELHLPVPAVQAPRVAVGTLLHLGRPMLPPGERLLERPHPAFSWAPPRHMVVEGVRRLVLHRLLGRVVYVFTFGPRRLPVGRWPRLLLGAGVSRWVALVDLHRAELQEKHWKPKKTALKQVFE